MIQIKLMIRDHLLQLTTEIFQYLFYFTFLQPLNSFYPHFHRQIFQLSQDGFLSPFLTLQQFIPFCIKLKTISFIPRDKIGNRFFIEFPFR